MASVAELARNKASSLSSVVKDASSTAINTLFRVNANFHIGYITCHGCVGIAVTGQNLRCHSEQIHCNNLHLETRSLCELE